MVDSTTEWINGGFNGGPTYVTDPGSYFQDIADGVAGDYIYGSDLGFLCSPFQNSIRMTLRYEYNMSKSKIPSQCTLTGIVGNIEDFYQDFSVGGWQGWFSMIQNDSNNPYGAYYQAQAELDNRIAKAVGLEKDQYIINDGFLSTRECKLGRKDPNTGKCLEYGETKTPGKVIESQLESVLGTGLSQLELADSFDSLINALLSQLLQKSVFSVQGLFSGGSKVNGSDGISGGGTQQATSQVTCAAQAQRATAGEDKVTWFLQSALDQGATYSWSGDEMSSASTTSISLIYKIPGIKSASVTAIPPPTDYNPSPSPITVKCQNTVLVSQYRPLVVSCNPEVFTTESEKPAKWDLFISGGSGSLQQIVWSGDENYAPKTHTSVWPNNYETGVTLTVNNYFDNDQNRRQSSLLQTEKTASSTKMIMTRVYMDVVGSKTAKVTVVDSDPTVQPVIDNQCTGSIYLSN